MNFIDTADVYGLGHSEKLVATAIKGHRNDIILSTKGGLIGHHYDLMEFLYMILPKNHRRIRNKFTTSSNRLY